MWYYYSAMTLLSAGNLFFAWRGYRLLRYHLKRIDESARKATEK